MGFLGWLHHVQNDADNCSHGEIVWPLKKVICAAWMKVTRMAAGRVEDAPAMSHEITRLTSNLLSLEETPVISRI